MAMFNRKRGQEISEALKQGNLAEVLRRKHPEPGLDSVTTQVFEKRPEAQRLQQRDEETAYDPASAYFALHHRAQEADQLLLDAITKGDAGKAADAIRRGAKANRNCIYCPAHVRNHCVLIEQITLLEYAKRQCREDIVELLKKHGAVE
jgi:hypothetical protein